MLRQPQQRVAWHADDTLDTGAFVRRVDAWVAALGARPGERFALYHSDSSEFLAILLALWHLQRIACIASDNQPGTVAMLQAHVDGFIGEFPATENLIAAAADAPAETTQWSELATDKVLLEIYTSGSSGSPKTITKNLAQLQDEVAALEALWPDDADTAVLSTVSHQHFYGLMIALLWPFSAGRRFATRTCEFPEDIIHRGARLERFTLVSSPSHLARFSPAFDWHLLAGRCVSAFSSAAPLQRADSLNAAALLGAPVREIYGSSETGAIAWRCQQETDVDAAWQGLPGVRLCATDEATLAVQAPYLDVDRQVLPDRVEFDAEGRFRLLGRVDRIVKVEGKRISLSAIEDRLRAHTGVDEVRALVLERVRVETAVVVQLTQAGAAWLQQVGRRALIGELKALLDGQLEAVAMPRRWRFVEQMPYNSQGKLPLPNLQALFVDDARWPQILDRQLLDGQLILHCRIPPGLDYFDGHILDRPILPGIVQLHWAEAFARRWLPVVGQFECLEVVKFQQVILPHYEVKISISFNADNGKLIFCYESERGVHSRGRICFKR